MNRRRLATVALVLVLGASACATDHRYDPLPVPEGADELPPTPSTVPRQLDEVALAPVGGTPTTEAPAIRPGPATIVGRVDGPDGPVANARVRLERFTEGGVAALEVPTAADGTWNAAGVLGGRYRIRAWLAPTLGMVRAQVVFVRAPDPDAVMLRLDRFEGVRIDAALAPSPPPVDAFANLKVRVTTRQVDARGFIRHAPVVGAAITLSGTGSWFLNSSNPTFTDAEGSALFEVQCLAAGPQPLSVFLDDGTSQELDLAPCA